MNRRWRHAKVALDVRFGRWTPVDLGVAVNEGQVLTLLLGRLLGHIPLAFLCYHTHKASARKRLSKWEYAGGSYEVKLIVGHITHGAVALEPLGQHAHQDGNLTVNVVIYAHLPFAGTGAVQSAHVLLERPAP